MPVTLVPFAFIESVLHIKMYLRRVSPRGPNHMVFEMEPAGEPTIFVSGFVQKEPPTCPVL